MKSDVASFEKDSINERKYFEQLLNEHAINNSDYIWIAKKYLRFNEENKALEYLKKAVLHGESDTTMRLGEFKKFNTLWRKFREEYPKLMAEFYSHFDMDLYTSLAQMTYNEQYVRTHIDTASLKKREKRYTFPFVQQVDSLNWSRLKPILDKDYPTLQQIGTKGDEYLHILLTHASTEHIEYLNPIFEKAVKNNLMSPMNYAVIMDRIEFYKQINNPVRYQVYGTSTMKGALLPIKDLENVDKQRLSIGLEPLFYTCKSRDIPLPKGYEYSYQNFLKTKCQ